MRRLVLVGLLGGAAICAVVVIRRRRALQPRPAGRAEWPPLTPAAAPSPWVDPTGGTCPSTHPVKANTKTGIYHVPGGRFYESVTPQRCYRDAAAAEADGLRPSKR